MIHVVNKKSGKCLVAWGGMTAGLGYKANGAQSLPDARYNIEGAAPVGLDDCANSELQRDDRHVWRQVPHLSGERNVSSFLSQTRRGDEGPWPQLGENDESVLNDPIDPKTLVFLQSSGTTLIAACWTLLPSSPLTQCSKITLNRAGARTSRAN